MNKNYQEYAKLVVEVGANVQKGQTLIISCPVDCAWFARLCASAAYDVGCREVVMRWSDSYMAREKALRADDAVFDECPAYLGAFAKEYAEKDTAFLSISASDPEALKGVDPSRLQRSARASADAMMPIRVAQMTNRMAWCIASIPVPSWAKKVFPGVSEEEAMEKLWAAIFKSVRITGEGNAVQLWREHLDMLAERKDKLNALRFKSLHYTNSLGTDLTIELPEGHLWAAGNSTTPKGVDFVANMPTEEIFTAPHREGVNGVVYAALPLVLRGSIVDKFHFVIKSGKIVEAYAEQGEENLRSAITEDEGASYFGEVALVPYDSPISNQNVLFYNTLFDENASCHLAFGEAYPECLEGGAEMSKEELKSRGLNDSHTHVDFMIGTPDLSIVGTTHDGREIPVFVDGNFAL